MGGERDFYTVHVSSTMGCVDVMFCVLAGQLSAGMCPCLLIRH